MSTVSIDFDSDGDVELVLEKEDTAFLKAAQPPSESRHDGQPALCSVGPLSVKFTEFRLRVSSLKLISSSCYFRGMFEGPSFRESKELKENGFVEIDLVDTDDEPAAVMIILGILYGSEVQVPAKLDFQTLYSVSILVDKYGWHALVTPHAISWLDNLLGSGDYSHVSHHDLLTWLWIAWLFGAKQYFILFSRVTQLFIYNSIDVMDENIRLPTRILGAINERRKAVFQKIEQTLEAFKKKILDYEAQNGYCSSPSSRLLICIALALVTFNYQEFRLGDFARPDYAGGSVSALRYEIQSSQSMQGFCITSPDGDRIGFDSGWDLKNELEKAMDDLKIDDWYLEYDDFKPSLVDGRQRRFLGV
ncbi:hypothetical protein F5884DRAFT_885137 [Xylogone sp. PMI_703]|nr:hypothetical protein F5884DRAFT_885137 [Xylogone sp. PMI_703]